MFRTNRGSPYYAHEISSYCYGFWSHELRMSYYATSLLFPGALVLESVMKPWIDSACGNRTYSSKTLLLRTKRWRQKDWMTKHFHEHPELMAT